MNNEKLIELRDIRKVYTLGKMDIEALRIDALTINTGEYVAILGPSGSGKSTLMNILGCLDRPTSGSYFLHGKDDVSKLASDELARVRNHEIGFIFQSFHLLAHSTALDNVALPLVYRGMGSAERRERAKIFLERVGLGNRLLHHPNELSGGQSQRVAIARALVTDPSIILADEPTGNLDSHSGSEVIRLFEECADAGKTVIIVTHDLSLAKRARRIIRLQDGQVVEDTH